MEDVFFGVSDSVSESCFSSTLDDFLPDWFPLGDDKQVTCYKSPGHEYDSDLSAGFSEVGSPLPDENMTMNIVSNLPEDNMDAEDLDSGLISFLTGNSVEENSETESTSDVKPIIGLDLLNRDENMNVTGTYRPTCSNPIGSKSDYNLRQNKAHSSSVSSNSDKVNHTPLKSTSVKLVRLVTPVTSGTDLTSADVVKAIEVKNKKNAQNAKMNREKKKVYIKGLEDEVEQLKTENHSLKEESKTLKHEKKSLLEEVAYLKSVLANESSLSALLKNIPSVRGVNLSSSFSANKRKADHDYEQVSKKARKAGVCLHVDGENASLEFCSHCSKLAKASGVDK